MQGLCHGVRGVRYGVQEWTGTEGFRIQKGAAG